MHSIIAYEYIKTKNPVGTEADWIFYLCSNVDHYAALVSESVSCVVSSDGTEAVLSSSGSGLFPS